MAGEIEAKLKAERMFAEAKAKAIGGPYANISKEYVNKYMDSSSLSKALAERVSTNYSLGYLSGWAGIPGDMLNALTSWAVSGIPDQRLRQQAKQSLTVAGTEDIGEAMGADVESEAFQWGTVGLPGLEDLVKKSPYLSMVLFHGTPHKFDKFDLSKIGTGEGAQAFGHGLYFAENPKVAGQYQQNLSAFNGVKYKGKEIPGRNIAAATDDPAVNEVLAAAANGGDTKQVLKDRRKFLMEDADAFGVDPAVKHVDEALSRFDEIMKDVDIQKGHLYEVDIPDEVVDQMLDWDALLSEQPEVMKRLKLEEQSGLIPRNTITPDMSGEQVYNALARGQTTYGTGSKEEASKLLAERGIPGIRFYDGSSRAKGEGTRNIVVFDPETSIKKVKRDGELVYEAGTN